MNAPAPLAGIRVLDMTRLLPGNYCTWLLACLGAEVIKVEDPGAGDYMRDFGVQVEGMGATHHVVNRSKSSVVIDLKNSAGRDVFLRLAATADVVVESFRPGVMERLGIGYPDLQHCRPSIVLASISGYGATGPLAAEAGHDINYLAFAGLLERLRADGNLPAIPIAPLADLIGGGLLTALGTLALLLRARQTGQGGQLESSLAEAVALLPTLVLSDLLAGQPPPPPGKFDLDGGLACYSVYRLADGLTSVGAIEARFWHEVCDVLGCPELVPIQNEPSRQDEIRERLAGVFAVLTREEVRQRFAGRDACVVVLNTMTDVVESEHARARELFRSAPQLPMRVPAPPFVIDGERPAEGGPAPRQGQHTAQVLGAAGFDAAEIARLIAEKVVSDRNGLPQKEDTGADS